ncbi:TPA: hypothetical protein HA241_04615 [Candidatus Woesearchaeota archaeon]|nr:hypothetical protein [Candidatus Woesearchaeota archaeon]
MSGEEKRLERQHWFQFIDNHIFSLSLIVGAAIIAGSLFVKWRNAVALLTGSESYYFLSTFSKWSLTEFILTSLDVMIPERWLVFIPLCFTLLTLSLAISIAQKLELSKTIVMVFMFFLLLSPTFLAASSTLSLGLLMMFYLLLALRLMLLPHRWMQWTAIIPLMLASLFSLSTTLLLIFFVSLFVILRKRDVRGYGVTVILTIIFLLEAALSSLPWKPGPFAVTEEVGRIFADLGGMNGISLFLLLLALVGIGVAVKKKERWWQFLIGALVLTFFVWSGTLGVFLSVIIILFAAQGAVALFQRAWYLPTLQKLTMFLIVLGIIFTLVSVITRIPLLHPNAEDDQALRWLEEHTLPEEVVFSDLEQSYFIHYFAQREPMEYPHHQQNKTVRITHAQYVDELFPILEENNVRHLLITPTMRRTLPEDQGLLFLLKNERFKIVYSSEGTEIWSFRLRS